jgi:hypothetical protein
LADNHKARGKLFMSYDVPNRDPAKIEALAEAVRDMAVGMWVADVVQALASVITTAVCDTSRSRDTARAIVEAVGEEMLSAVEEAERPGWPTKRRQ